MTDSTRTPANPAASDTDVAETQIQRPDSTMFGGYELLAEVARGGMGVVYKARQIALDRIVALKLVLSGSDASQGELSRFQVEARAAARLDHPHIVPVYEISKYDGQHFFSMGFVDGPSLSVRLAQSGPLPPREAAEILRKVAEAVDYAHGQGVIHRDLKPGNVLLTPTGEPMVTDFGLAKRIDSEHSLTATGQVLGTPAYMAPEQALGDHVTIGPAADIYSLGATLFAVLTGRPPFTATAIHELLIQVTEEPPPAPRTINPKVPAALEAICLKCLAKLPADRYSSAGALAEDLGRFLDFKRVTAARKAISDRTRIWWAVGAACLLILGAVGVWYRQQASPNSPQMTASSTPDRASLVATPLTSDEKLLQALAAAPDTLLPTPAGNVWEFRYADAAAACEAAFREFGFTLDQGDPSQLSETLKGRSAEFRESVLCGLELWELCAVAAKQTTVIDQLRQAQDALDTLEWRRSLRLARSDADMGIIRLVVDQAISQSPTPEQIRLLALLIGSRTPETNPDAQGLLQRLLETSPQDFLMNLVHATTLEASGRAQPNRKVTYLLAAVAPLKAAANARPGSWLPHMQLAAVYRDTGYTEAAATERERANELLYPEAWPLLTAARKKRTDKDYLQAIKLAREALAKHPGLPGGEVELAAGLLLSGQIADAESVLRTMIETAPSEGAAFDLVTEACRLGIPTSSLTGRPLFNFVESRRPLAQALHYFRQYRPNLSAAAWGEFGFYTADLDYDVRLTGIKKAVELAPDDRIFLPRLVRLLCELNRDHDYVLANIRDPVLSDEWYGLDLRTALAWTLSRKGDREQGLNEYRKMFEQWPKLTASQPIARFREYLVAFDQIEEGLPLFESLALRAPSQGTFLEIGLLYRGIGNEGKARQFIQRALGNSNISPEQFNFVLGLCTAGETDAALRIGITQLEASPTNWKSHLGPAIALALQGAFDESLGEAQMARTLAVAVGLQSVSDLQGINNYHMEESTLGRVLMSRREYSQAAEVLGDLYRANRNEAGYYGPMFGVKGDTADYVRALLALGQVEEAEVAITELLQMRPEEGAVRWANGLVRLTRGHLGEAAEELKLARRRDPLNGLISLDLGMALLRVGDFEAAMIELQRAVAMYQRRQIREFRLVPFEAAVAVFEATRANGAPSGALPDATRESMQDTAFTWLSNELATWERKVNGTVRRDQSAAAQVLNRVLDSEIAKKAHAAELLDGLSAERRQKWSKLWDDVAVLNSAAQLQRSKIEGDSMVLWKQLPKVDRKVAEWVLQRGGSVTVRSEKSSWLTQHFRTPAELPAESFSLIGISLRDCSVADDDWKTFDLPPSLQQLFLEGTPVTEARVREIIDGAPALSVLSLERTAVSDTLLDSLGHLQSLYVRGTRISPEALSSFASAHADMEIVPRSVPIDLSSRSETQQGKNNFELSFDGYSKVDLPLSREAALPTTLECFVSFPAQLFRSHSYPLIGTGKSAEEKVQLLAINFTDYSRLRGESRSDVGANIHSSTSAKVPAEQRTHLAVAFDGAEMRTYLDGTPVAKIAVKPTPGGSGLKYCIGSATWHTTLAFTGTVDEVRISSIARYTGVFVPTLRHEPDEHTLALYHFDEGEGDVVKDSSGSNHHGKIVGQAKWVKSLPFVSRVPNTSPAPSK